jgi:hypothetical protein
VKKRRYLDGYLKINAHLSLRGLHLALPKFSGVIHGEGIVIGNELAGKESVAVFHALGTGGVLMLPGNDFVVCKRMTVWLAVDSKNNKGRTEHSGWVSTR